MEIIYYEYYGLTKYVVMPRSRGSTRDNCRVFLIGFQFFGTQSRTRKVFGILVRLKNGTPTQPIRRTKLTKFSKHLKFYRKFDKVSFVI